MKANYSKPTAQVYSINASGFIASTPGCSRDVWVQQINNDYFSPDLPYTGAITSSTCWKNVVHASGY